MRQWLPRSTHRSLSEKYARTIWHWHFLGVVYLSNGRSVKLYCWSATPILQIKKCRLIRLDGHAIRLSYSIEKLLKVHGEIYFWFATSILKKWQMSTDLYPGNQTVRFSRKMAPKLHWNNGSMEGMRHYIYTSTHELLQMKFLSKVRTYNRECIYIYINSSQIKISL